MITTSITKKKRPIPQNLLPPLTHSRHPLSLLPNVPQQDHSAHPDADRDVRRQGGYREIIFGAEVEDGGRGGVEIQQIRIMNVAAPVPTTAGNDAHKKESNARAPRFCVPPESAAYTHPTLRLLKRKREILPLHTFLFLSPIRFRSPPPRPRWMAVCVSVSRYRGWRAWVRAGHTRVPAFSPSASHFFRSYPRSLVAGPGPEHRRGGASSSSSGVESFFPPPLGPSPARSPSSHAFGGAWGLWNIFFPFSHSHRSRRGAQKEKRVHLDAGPARRSAPSSPCCGLWCMEDAKLDANGLPQG